MPDDNRQTAGMLSEEAFALADELARRSGLSMAEVVAIALKRLKIEALPIAPIPAEEAKASAREIMARIRSSHPKGPQVALNWEDDFYDEYGLPK